MEKILKKYTTIPEHLYVERSADNQLRTIIDEMERPGYVLVARQMGKTNLLFNAKRTLENDKRLFVYVDLSSFFKLEKDCYRNIIDNIIEPNEDIFEEIESKIYEIREQDLPSNKEYSKCLRVILKYFDGDIIIILDEIDALASTDYSDHIFAQIRSTYFARTNFPIYNHLTYILSGVVEPSDLIKDKNKSPFNIGEKIYLNDFTKEEHDAFIIKSQLKISKENADEIFAWTSGNPRLTFDICSDIENNIINGILLDRKSIEKLIRKKYLVNFDIPPIDHIRELVRTNKIMRDAIVSIQKGINNISDEVKHKLYLYGVINSSFDKKTLIKNKIISESLPLDWLNSFETTLTSILLKWENKEYQNVIEELTKLLKESKISNIEIEICHMFIGQAYFELSEYQNAIKYLSFSFEIDDYKGLALLFLGRCYVKENIKEAINIFTQVIDLAFYDSAYYNSLLELAKIQEKNNQTDDAFKLYQKLFNDMDKAKTIEDEQLNEFRSTALYLKAKNYYKNEKTKEALIELEKAKAYADNSNLLAILYLQYKYEINKNELLKSELVQILITNKILFNEDNFFVINFNQLSLMTYIDWVFNNNDLTLFNEIIEYAEENLFQNTKNKLDIIYELSEIETNNQKEYLHILNNTEEITKSLHIRVLKDLSLFYVDNSYKFLKYFDEYLELFNQEYKKINSKDILLFALAIKENSDKKNFTLGLKLCEIIEEKITNIEDKELEFEFLIIYYWKALIYFDLNNREKSLFYCNKTLFLINDSGRNKTSVLDEEGLKGVIKLMNDIKDSYKKRKPLIRNKKYGRNEIVKVEYLDGTIRQGKYKKLESDILAERCKIL